MQHTRCWCREIAHMGGLASLHMRGLALQVGSSCEVLAELL